MIARGLQQKVGNNEGAKISKTSRYGAFWLFSASSEEEHQKRKKNVGGEACYDMG